jgi:hypothetical protein
VSDTPFSYAFPQRTPVFTAGLVLLCFALFGWLAYKVYVPKAFPPQRVEGVRTVRERLDLLAEQRMKDQSAATSYAWVDQSAGAVRLPVERAMALTVREQSRK